MLTPYEHQKEFIDALREATKTNKAIIARAETGFGKTIIATWLALNVEDFFMTVHRKALLRQTRKTFKKFGVDPNKVIMVSKLKTLNKPTLVFVDEAHHSMANTWKVELLRLKKAGTFLIGGTATPLLQDGQGLGGIYDTIVEAKNMQWLIKNKFLSEYKYYAPYIPNMKGVKKTAKGEFSPSAVSEIMSGKIIANALDKYKELCGNKRVIAFASSVQASKDLVSNALNKKINAVHIDGTMKEHEIEQAILSFATNGGILSNYGICGEGFDLEAQLPEEMVALVDSLTVEGIMMLRPTQSLALYRQMVGRALRKKDYPAIILDFAGNMERHGLPDDTIVWGLEGKEKRKIDDIAVQRCPACFNIQRPAKECKDCGHIFVTESRFLEEIQGEMVLIDTAEWRAARLKEVADAEELEEFVKIEKKRGYKNKWAEIRYREKHGWDLYGDRKGIELIAEVRKRSAAWVWQECNRRRIR